MTGTFRRRRLRHWDVADATYFVTACLAGSVPAIGLRELDEYRRALELRLRPVAMTETDWEHYKHKLVFVKLDEWLDGKPAVRHFDQATLAAVVQRSIFHFAGQRYHVLAYVVMPSHLHWVFHPIPEWCETIASGVGFQPANSPKAGLKPAPRRIQRTPREIIMHSLKSFTANECNKILKKKGPFWQDESHDHWVRDEDELFRIIEYIEQNPVKAGLAASPAEFVLSSAHDRRASGIRAGEPLFPPRGADFQPAKKQLPTPAGWKPTPREALRGAGFKPAEE